MTMHEYNAIVIGSGLGGLIAGATLSKYGKKVMVLEQHYIPGGCATGFKRKDYVVEVGLHEMEGLFEKDIKVKFFEFLEVNKHVEFIKVPELFHLKTKTRNFTFPHQTENARKALIDAFPLEKRGIDKFLNIIDGVLGEIKKFPQEKWKAIMLFSFMPLLFPNLVKASPQTLGEWLDKNIHNEELKLILQANLLYYHDDPYSLSMMFFSVAQASFIGGGGYFIYP